MYIDVCCTASSYFLFFVFLFSFLHRPKAAFDRLTGKFEYESTTEVNLPSKFSFLRLTMRSKERQQYERLTVHREFTFVRSIVCNFWLDLIELLWFNYLNSTFTKIDSFRNAESNPSQYTVRFGLIFISLSLSLSLALSVSRIDVLLMRTEICL